MCVNRFDKCFQKHGRLYQKYGIIYGISCEYISAFGLIGLHQGYMSVNNIRDRYIIAVCFSGTA